MEQEGGIHIRNRGINEIRTPSPQEPEPHNFNWPQKWTVHFITDLGESGEQRPQWAESASRIFKASTHFNCTYNVSCWKTNLLST
jgi:hypothetical protein